MKTKTKLTLILTTSLTLIFLVCSASSSLYYKTNWYFGMPDYGTFMNFDDERTFTSAYQTGDKVYIDNYIFAVENANATFNVLFDSPNIVQVTLQGSTDTESTLTIDASSYGYTHSPQTISYTGAVANVHHEMTPTQLILHAIHLTTDNIIYEINWAGTSSVGGGGTVTTITPIEPDELTEPPTTQEPTSPDQEEPTTQQPDNLTTPIILIAAGVAITAILITPNKKKRKKRKVKTPDWNQK